MLMKVAGGEEHKKLGALQGICEFKREDGKGTKQMTINPQWKPQKIINSKFMSKWGGALAVPLGQRKTCRRHRGLRTEVIG